VKNKLIRFSILVLVALGIYIYPTGVLLVIMYLYTRRQAEILTDRLKKTEEALNETRGVVQKLKRKYEAL
jgi:hypothetical protein